MLAGATLRESAPSPGNSLVLEAIYRTNTSMFSESYAAFKVTMFHREFARQNLYSFTTMR